MKSSGRWAAFGPGLLFAATAVGVSHLVQATRAGETTGLGLIGWICLAHALKYPAFRFAAHYAAATGTSLLQGYRRQGKWALGLYAFVTLGTMFTVQAAVTVVTAGLVLAALGTRASPFWVSVFVLVGCFALGAGRFRTLDRLTRGLMAVLAVSTVVAAGLVLPEIKLDSARLLPPEGASFAFLVALMGWMPTAPDVSVWQSLWILARARERGDGEALDRRRILFDFDVGYVGTAALAVAFVLLGAGLLHGPGVSLPASVPGFARGLVGAYTEALGGWAHPLISVCALSAMASTTITVLDGFPRALAQLVLRFRTDETETEETTGAAERLRWAATALLVAGTLVVLGGFLTSLKELVDVATTLSFLTAPVLCGLNHRAVFARELPAEQRPSSFWYGASLISIMLQIVLAVAFVSSLR